MKKIHLLILKSFIRPFIVTFFIVMFVLLMLFLFKYIDDLIGKGFAWYIIMELMMYASATNVAMALPLSVLLSSIMTYGDLGENYELVAIKSAGISLGRALYPMIIVVTMLSIGAFFFSNYMLPVANLKYYSLLFDARKQKTAFLINENVFNTSFPGYAIRVKHKDPDGQTLHNIMLYERPLPQSNNINVTFAQEGVMYRSADNMWLILRLKNGIRHEEKPPDNGYGNQRQQYVRFRFKELVQKIDLSSFTMKRTDESGFKGASQMMDLKLLTKSKDSLVKLIYLGYDRNYSLITPYFKYFNVPLKPSVKPVINNTDTSQEDITRGKKLLVQNANLPVKNLNDSNTTTPRDSIKHKKHLAIKKAPPIETLLYNKGKTDYLKGLAHEKQLSVIQNALAEARQVKDQVKSRVGRYEELIHDVHQNQIDYQKKFTLSVACLSLFLIGAPLGAIIRKGGLGLPVVVAIVFFLIYYIISTIGEKFVKDGGTSPFVGMWISIFILTPIGIFLSYKAANDSEIFNVEAYNRLIKKIMTYWSKLTAR